MAHNRFTDKTLFLWQFLRYPYHVGSITPSSAALSAAMTRYVKKDNPETEERRYLEAGAGTGVFTQAIVDKLGPNEQLDVIEINPEFCRRLQKKYIEHKNVTIHQGSILDWKPPYQYDVVISSLPFNLFKASQVTSILDHYCEIAKPEGVLSFYEYMALPRLKRMFLKPGARHNLQETLDVIREFKEKFEMRTDKVFANFPPACVHHCQFTKTLPS